MKRRIKYLEIWIQDPKEDPFYYFQIDTSYWKRLKDVLDEILFDCTVDDVDANNLPKGIKFLKKSEVRDSTLERKSIKIVEKISNKGFEVFIQGDIKEYE